MAIAIPGVVSSESMTPKSDRQNAMKTIQFLTGLCLTLSCSLAAAQGVPGGGGGFGGGGQGGGGQGGFPGGIVIDADGLIQAAQGQKINSALEKRKLQIFAGQHLEGGLNSTSVLRKVSLNRIDAALSKAIETNETVPFEIQHLAGLTSIEFIVFDQENNDVILAGPAEGFATSSAGRVVGVESGRPTLKLDDLLVVLRLDSSQQQLGCSFDPEPSRLAKANAWNKANSSPASVAVARERFVQMARILGPWNVTVFGVPDDCHAALTAVEADFELKRLALGLVRPRIRRFQSQLQLARPGENMMRRWWLAPLYNMIEQTPDGTTFRLSGPRLQLMSQEELVDLQGNRSNAAFTEVSAERYTKQFNQHIEELCEQVPSFAATQNLFDLAVAAALIRRANRLGQIDWQPQVLGSSEKLPHLAYSTPKQVPSMVNVKTSGRSLLIGFVGGGVTIVPDHLLSKMDNLPEDEQPHLAKAADPAAWWWD